MVDYEKYINVIKNAKTKLDIIEVIDAIYEEGFTDGKGYKEPYLEYREMCIDNGCV